MGAHKKDAVSPPPPHKNAKGEDCICASAILHHLDSRGMDCICFIGKDHHRNSKGEECVCRIGMNHNTKAGPHKDGEGRECKGPFMPDLTSSVLKRVCNWCRREETYSPVMIAVIFKKGITPEKAVEFLTDFSLNGKKAVIIADEERNIIEKKGVTAVTVSAALAAGKPDEWIAELEKHAEYVSAAIRVMDVSFPDYGGPQALQLPEKHSGGGKDFPDEFQKA